MFGVLNNLDTKQFDDYTESFNRTERSEIRMKDDETNKENGMRGIY
jgi:hypothetical protein